MNTAAVRRADYKVKMLSVQELRSRAELGKLAKQKKQLEHGVKKSEVEFSKLRKRLRGQEKHIKKPKERMDLWRLGEKKLSKEAKKLNTGRGKVKKLATRQENLGKTVEKSVNQIKKLRKRLRLAAKRVEVQKESLSLDERISSTLAQKLSPTSIFSQGLGTEVAVTRFESAPEECLISKNPGAEDPELEVLNETFPSDFEECHLKTAPEHSENSVSKEVYNAAHALPNTDSSPGRDWQGDSKGQHQHSAESELENNSGIENFRTWQSNSHSGIELSYRMNTGKQVKLEVVGGNSKTIEVRVSADSELERRLVWLEKQKIIDSLEREGISVRSFTITGVQKIQI